MKILGRARDRHGVLWTVKLMSLDEAEDEDARFWLEEMSPEERVEAVDECVADWLKIRGKRAPPVFRRVCRLVEREEGQVSHRRRPRRRLSR